VNHRWRLTLALWLMLPSAAAMANPADLDTTFAMNGMARLSLDGFGNSGQDAVLQPDGKIVVLSHAYPDDAATIDELAVTRYNPDGTLDLGFGSGGTTITNYGFGPTYPLSLQLTAANDILVRANGFGSQGQVGLLIKYRGDTGMLDEQFGDGGIVAAPSTSPADFFQGSVPLSDSGLLAALESPYTGSMLVKYTGAGEIDTSFGDQGVVTSPVGARGLLQLPDGNIIVTGYHTVAPEQYEMAFAKMDASGTFDTTYGEGGIASVPLDGLGFYVGAGGFQHDGSVLIAVGEALVRPRSIIVIRLDPKGTWDVHFGDAGFASTDLGGSTNPTSMSVLPNDRFVVGSNSEMAYRGMTLVSYLADGSLDTSFGDAGISEVGALGLTAAVLFQPNGGLLEVGTLWNDDETQAATVVVRHVGWPDELFRNGFD